MRVIRRRVLPAVLFVCLNAFAGIALPVRAQTTAPNEWTWIGGSNTANPLGAYGRLGTPATGNIPGGRDSAATWTDSSGNFWLFGGEGFDANGNFGLPNDLWEFNPTVSEWTWMSGSNTLPVSCAGSTTLPCGQPGVYGTSGSAAVGNVPGGRILASYWTDNSGNFWLFGGVGFDADQNLGELNDLWEFNPSTEEWTWMGGSSTLPASCAGSASAPCGQSGVYGMLGSAAVANVPSSRDSATSWIDKGGQLWMYGGEGFDGQGNYGQLNDLWAFEPSNNQWTWMGGNSTLPTGCATGPNNGMCGWPVLYGTLGVPAAGLSPGSRVAPAGWTDNNGNFWLFGGLNPIFWENNDFALTDQYDLWEFNSSSKQWAWMGGNSTSTCMEGGGSPILCGQGGIFGTQGIPAIANIPTSRNNATTWTDSAGNLWLLGGDQVETTIGIGGGLCNDFWVFEPAANEWAWMTGTGQSPYGSCVEITPGTYGVLGTPAAGNTPSGRLGAASWTDSHGNLWVFGGLGYTQDTSFFEEDLNDLWVYQPAAPAPQPSFELVASPNPVNIGAMGSGTPSITAGTTTVNILAAAGFNAPVTLTATTDTMNGITDITGSFSPATITGAGSSLLTISVTGTAVLIAGPIPLTITATSGGTSQSIQVIVDVTKIGQIPAPTFSVPAGTYFTPQTVSIVDTYTTDYNNMFIYYTTDGSTPTASSAVYVNPITVASTATLKAIAIDPFYDQSGVSSATYTIVPPTPNFSITGTAVSVARGATAGNTSTITLTPSDGFTGVIRLSCTITPTASSDPATCGIPTSVTITGSGAQTATLTVNTMPATTVASALRRVGKFLRSSVGGTALACILLIGIPGRWRRWWSVLAMLVLLSCAVGGAFGCSGSGSGGAAGGGTGGNSGTTPGTYIITVTGTSGTITQRATISLSVQ